MHHPRVVRHQRPGRGRRRVVDVGFVERQDATRRQRRGEAAHRRRGVPGAGRVVRVRQVHHGGAAAGARAVPRPGGQRRQIHLTAGAVRHAIQRHAEGCGVVGEGGVGAERHHRAPAVGRERPHHQREQVIDAGAHQHLLQVHAVIRRQIGAQVVVLGVAVPGEAVEGGRGRRPCPRRHAEGALVGPRPHTKPTSRPALQGLRPDEWIGRLQTGDQPGKRRGRHVFRSRTVHFPVSPMYSMNAW